MKQMILSKPSIFWLFSDLVGYAGLFRWFKRLDRGTWRTRISSICGFIPPIL
ncbi:hypothetical protein GbCGDNIH6_8251 [Granulibacter bethesdensis]|nr:hypothetical protein GbCGDNIH6_8251 [Granulibacter bethesdensis]